MMRLLLSLLLLLSFLQMNAQTYPKVILPGDYPDPSIMRDGKDYYMTHSPFYYAPGFLIWHSQDLMNWEPLCRVMPQYEGSAMAPDLLKYKDTYYIYYPAAGTNWVMWAKDIRGPWSLPVDLKVGGIDPGHVVDREGNRYLYVDKGEVIRLTEDGLATVGEKKKVYDGWKYPDHWDTECMCLESPKLNEHNGYYYLTSAQGGTAGPATSHMVVSARSKSVTGPWENSPYNPIVHTYSATDSWWSKGHGTLIDDVNGNWWIVYHAYANGYHTLGRSTLIEPIEWTEDGWYRTVSAATPVTPEQEIKHGLELSDDFKGPQLGLQWTFWKEYAPKSLTFKEDILWMKAKGRTPADGRVLLTTAEDKNYETQVEIRTGNGNVAGLILYYNEKAYAGVVSDGKRFYIYRNAEHKTELPNRIGKHFFARLHNCGNRLSVEVSKDGEEWTVLASDMDVSSLHHNNYGGFYALRVGLFSAGKGSSGFSRFRYRNAVPREKDMSAYLMVFHKDEDHGLHMAISPDGYTFTALNEGKPVIAGDTIAEQKGIRDPHIFRGPDGAFYLSMTDLHIYAQRDGYRDTEWERDGKEYGWGNNRGLVLMKSWDLIHWKRTNLRFDKLSAAYSEVGCAWAPEVTYDDKKGKLMMYFTMRFKNEANKLYYVYVNDDFDKLETLPQLLFQYPDEKISAIDADITRIEDKYHMFYVSHDGGAGIKQAVSWKLSPTLFRDFTKTSVLFVDLNAANKASSGCFQTASILAHGVELQVPHQLRHFIHGLLIIADLQPIGFSLHAGPHSVSRMATGVSTSTVSPSPISCFFSTPSWVASIWLTTLSVSISNRGSPAETGSPSSFSQAHRTPFSISGRSRGMTIFFSMIKISLSRRISGYISQSISSSARSGATRRQTEEKRSGSSRPPSSSAAARPPSSRGQSTVTPDTMPRLAW